MKIYLFLKNFLLSQGQYDILKNFACNFVLNGISTAKNQEYAEQKLISNIMLKTVIAENLKIDKTNIIFQKNKQGKLFIPDNIIEFNISHSDDIYAAAIDKLPVGIDIQKKVNKNKKIVDRFFTENEKQFIENSVSPNDAFTKIWTFKESYGKAIGEGLNSRILKTETCTQFGLSKTIYDFNLETVTVFKDFHLTVCSKNESDQIDIKEITIENLMDYYKI